MIWLYGLGFAFLHGGYVDLMRSRGSAQNLKIIFELIGGISYFVFFIWGFFVFEWWVPLVMPLLGVIPATFITSKVFNLPHLFIVIGCLMCSYSLA